MLIKWGSIVVDGSGKLGGHVFSKSRGGATVRTIARATNPQTSFQQIIRSRFTRLSQNWRDLTEVQRESWYQAESSFSRTNRFGDVVTLSGKNLYESLNANRQIIGLGVINLAPLPTEIPVAIVTSANVSVSNGSMVISGMFKDSTDFVIVATEGLSQGSRNGKNKLRIIGIAESFTDGTAIAGFNDVYDDYVARLGIPNSSRKIFIGVYSISVSGQRSPVSSVVAKFV